MGEKIEKALLLVHMKVRNKVQLKPEPLRFPPKKITVLTGAT